MGSRATFFFKKIGVWDKECVHLAIIILYLPENSSPFDIHNPCTARSFGHSIVFFDGAGKFLYDTQLLLMSNDPKSTLRAIIWYVLVLVACRANNTCCTISVRLCDLVLGTVASSDTAINIKSINPHIIDFFWCLVLWIYLLCNSIPFFKHGKLGFSLCALFERFVDSLYLHHNILFHCLVCPLSLRFGYVFQVIWHFDIKKFLANIMRIMNRHIHGGGCLICVDIVAMDEIISAHVIIKLMT